MECGDEKAGHVKVGKWVVVDPAAPPSNYDPVVRLDASKTTGDASLSISFFVSGSDPDGDDIRCSVGFGDGSPTKSVALDAPAYNQVWVPHTYHTAARDPYRAELTCTDGNGGTSRKVVDIQVNRSDSALLPVIESFDASPSAGDAPLDVTFNLTVADTDSSQVNCTLDYGDGASYNLIQLVPFTIDRDHRYSGGSYMAHLYCCDDVGFDDQCGPQHVGVASASRPIYSSAPNSNPVVDLSLRGTTRERSLDVAFIVAALDPDRDPLSCTLDPGAFHDVQEFVFAYPYDPMEVPYTYDVGTTYEATLSCSDGKGGDSVDTVTVTLAALPGSGERQIVPEEGRDGTNDVSHMGD